MNVPETRVEPVLLKGAKRSAKVLWCNGTKIMYCCMNISVEVSRIYIYTHIKVLVPNAKCFQSVFQHRGIALCSQCFQSEGMFVKQSKLHTRECTWASASAHACVFELRFICLRMYVCTSVVCVTWYTCPYVSFFLSFFKWLCGSAGVYELRLLWLGTTDAVPLPSIRPAQTFSNKYKKVDLEWPCTTFAEVYIARHSWGRYQ